MRGTEPFSPYSLGILKLKSFKDIFEREEAPGFTIEFVALFIVRYLPAGFRELPVIHAVAFAALFNVYKYIDFYTTYLRLLPKK